MRTVLVDVNVILDVLLDRKPHVEASSAVWTAMESGFARGLLAAHAVTTIHYLIRKELDTLKAKRSLAAMLRVFGVAAVDGAVIQLALELQLPDFEDAVSAAAAQLAGCEYIVTRDPAGFRASPVRCLPPEAAAPLLQGR
jgi:predicted nucleic acid-binding protein